MKRRSLPLQVLPMSRSRFTIIVFLVAVIVGPIWLFENARQDDIAQTAMVVPGSNPMVMPTQQVGNRALIPIGYSNNSSPASLPTSAVAGQQGQPGLPAMGSGATAQVSPFGAMTATYPGNQQGPDLQAGPMQFVPVTSFAEIFRFDISPEWVKSRWERVSTSTIGGGFSGMRVPLVTGVNSWDIHGSLTYYFDRYKKVQRIGFHGWTGDPGRLVDGLERQYGFQSQPTLWAGYYLGRRDQLFGKSYFGGLFMRNPAVINSRDQTHQVALLLEINKPSGTLSLSDEFQRMQQEAGR